MLRVEDYSQDELQRKREEAERQKKLEKFAEKMCHLETLEHCEKTLYRLVPNLPQEQS